MYVVILAGGGGTRLWPLSTPARPKPFLPLLGDETLFQRTARRLLDGDELGLDRDDLVVVTDARYGGLVRAQAPGVAVLEEPVGRNTAAAIALATITVERDDDDVMLVVPADQVIEREDVFRGVVAAAGAALAHGSFGIESPLVTLGIQPTRAATEYGYLIPHVERGEARGGLLAYPLVRFQEKPDAATAATLVAQQGVAWNAGMFLWRRRAIRAALATYAPDVLEAVQAAHARGDLATAYPSIRSTSIDYAVMESAAADGQVVMGAMDVGWSDLGSWGSLLEALGVAGDGRVVQAGEAASVAPGELIVRRVDGGLRLDVGPRQGILDADGPSAVLSPPASARATVEALLRRASDQEDRP